MNSQEAIVREIALKVDSITLIVERLEELIIRAHEVATVLMLPPSGPGSRLVTELALGRPGGVTARTKEEAQAGEEALLFCIYFDSSEVSVCFYCNFR